jgi:hypothetical protein
MDRRSTLNRFVSIRAGGLPIRYLWTVRKMLGVRFGRPAL